MFVAEGLGILLALATALPLARQWQLGVGRTAVFILAIGAVVGLLVAAVAFPAGVVWRALAIWAVTLGIALGYLAYRFYRDPERVAPRSANALVSPADGEVIYVRSSRGGVLPVSTKQGRDYTLDELTRTPLASDEAVVVGIAMSFLDVHVNRAPIAGQVRLQRHFPGRFGSLRHPEMVFQNERATTVITRDDLEVAVVQIASRLVRQIVSFVREGQAVALGDRIGVIRLGSQVDLVLPARPDLVVTVQVGQRVRAGETVVAEITDAGHLAVEAGSRPRAEECTPA